MAERLGEVISGAWLGLYEGGRSGKSGDGRDWNETVEVKWKWEVEAQEKSKLGVMESLLVHGSKDRCMDVKCKRLRRMVAMLRGGTAALRSETGRWSGVKREERICRQCTMGEIEDKEHFLLSSEDLKQERRERST